MDYSTFDTTFALSSFMLWLLFSYLTNLMSCDFQRFMKQHEMFKHFIALLAFFFLFTILDANNNAPVYIIWFKTVFVYVLFLMTMKAKWFFVTTVLAILVADQTIKMHINYLTKNEEKNENKENNGNNGNNGNKEEIGQYEYIRELLNGAVIGVIVVGFTHYGLRQYEEFGKEFTFRKLLFGTSCRT